LKFKLAIPVLLCLSVLFFSSCKKDQPDNESKAVTLNVTQSSADTYTLDLSQYGDADDLTAIQTQATAFITSEINQNATSGKSIYTYTSIGNGKAGYTGTDKVVLKVYEPAGRKHCDETIITINFTIQ
jgi:hypothetical protein